MAYFDTFWALVQFVQTDNFEYEKWGKVSVFPFYFRLVLVHLPKIPVPSITKTKVWKMATM